MLLNTYSVSPSQKDILNVEQFKEICQCILDSQGIDGKTSSVYGNYQKEKEKLSEAFDESNEDERFYTLSGRNHAIISNYKKLPLEEIVDEMLAILSDRNRIMQKHDLEETNARWNEYLNG